MTVSATRRVVRIHALGAAVVAATIAASPAWAQEPAALRELVDAAAQRLQTADPVAAVKWDTGASIEDPSRVQQVIDAVSAAATARGIDPGYVTAAFNDQIHATEAIEYTRFAQWKLDPASAPTAAPDLSASRSAIDALNNRMVSEIALHWDTLHSSMCVAELDAAKDAIVAARRLDGVYVQALSFATRSYCRP